MGDNELYSIVLYLIILMCILWCFLLGGTKRVVVAIVVVRDRRVMLVLFPRRYERGFPYVSREYDFAISLRRVIRSMFRLDHRDRV